MTNLLRSYLGLDKEPEPESKPDPRLEKTTKFVRSKKKEKKVDSRLGKKSEFVRPVKKIEKPMRNRDA